MLGRPKRRLGAVRLGAPRRRFGWPTSLAGFILILTIGFAFALQLAGSDQETDRGPDTNGRVELPAARTHETELGELIYRRRSVRDYTEESIGIEEASDLLWAAVGLTVDGVTGPTRAAPSAGATDPLVVYLSVRRVEGLEPGVYRYLPEDHELAPTVAEDRSAQLASAALGQGAVRDAPVSLLVTADYGRTTGRYGDRGERYVHIEAGHAAQNANLMAENLGFAGVMIGAFDDGEMQAAAGGIDEDPLLIVPIGRAK